MTWPLHHDFEIFSRYLDTDVKKTCPKIQCFTQLSLENFSFLPKTKYQAQKMYYFHFRHRFFYSDVILHSSSILEFSIKSSCLTRIYKVSIKYPSNSISLPDCINQIQYSCTCKHFVYFRNSNCNSKHCKHIIYCILNLINS